MRDRLGVPLPGSWRVSRCPAELGASGDARRAQERSPEGFQGIQASVPFLCKEGTRDFGEIFTRRAQ